MVIGGDFELEPELHRGSSRAEPELPLTGRTALHQILRHLSGRRPGTPIYLPAYLCGSMLMAARGMGGDVCFLDVDAGLRIADPSRIQPGAIVVLVRYFGLVDLAEEVTRLRSLIPDLLIVADEVQAPWAFGEPTGADFSFTSWRKAYPVAGGAPTLPRLAWRPRSGMEAFVALRLAASSLKRLVRHGEPINDEVYLSLFRRAEAMLDDGACLSAGLQDPVSTSLPQEVTAVLDVRRRRNFAHLRERIAAFGIEPLLDLQPGATPLFLPILLERGIRDPVREELAEARIYCPVHWPRPLDVPRDHTGAAELYERELSLVIDHRYGEADMDRIAEALGRAIKLRR